MSPGKVPLYAGLFFLAAVFFGACGGPPPALDVSRSLDAPAVYRVSATAESRFSGPVSDLEGTTELTAAFKATPISDSRVEVETLYLAASVEDANGEPAALNLEPLVGRKATVELESPGSVAGVRGDPALLDAPVPLIPVREVIWSLFPPLPQEATQEDDTWTGDSPMPFANLDAPPTRMRYVLEAIDSSNQTGRVAGYELSVRPPSFRAPTVDGEVSGEGDLDVEFEGEFRAGEGYERTERTIRFDSNFIRLSGGDYANGNLRMRYALITERLNPAEQFGLDAAAGRGE